jgi:4-amino-4-deoxy-L-arabinose transferase-like glycosyltransferase
VTADPLAAPAGGKTADRLALAVAALLLLALALYGSHVHWVEEAGTAERDGYVGQAQQLLSGSLPRDPYRPLLFPLLTAALAPLTGGPFAAARLLSNLAAAGLAWMAYAYGRRLAGAAAGGWAIALAAVNPNLWIIGQHVTTDMLFAALAAASLLAGLHYLQAPAAAPALAAGLALGLAAFTRANALFLVPALLAAWLLAPVAPGLGGRRRRLGHHAMAAGASATSRWPPAPLPPSCCRTGRCATPSSATPSTTRTGRTSP